MEGALKKKKKRLLQFASAFVAASSGNLIDGNSSDGNGRCGEAKTAATIDNHAAAAQSLRMNTTTATAIVAGMGRGLSVVAKTPTWPPRSVVGSERTSQGSSPQAQARASFASGIKEAQAVVSNGVFVQCQAFEPGREKAALTSFHKVAKSYFQLMRKHLDTAREMPKEVIIGSSSSGGGGGEVGIEPWVAIPWCRAMCAAAEETIKKIEAETGEEKDNKLTTECSIPGPAGTGEGLKRVASGYRQFYLAMLKEDFIVGEPPATAAAEAEEGVCGQLIKLLDLLGKTYRYWNLALQKGGDRCSAESALHTVSSTAHQLLVLPFRRTLMRHPFKAPNEVPLRRLLDTYLPTDELSGFASGYSAPPAASTTAPPGFMAPGSITPGSLRSITPGSLSSSSSVTTKPPPPPPPSSSSSSSSSSLSLSSLLSSISST